MNNGIKKIQNSKFISGTLVFLLVFELLAGLFLLSPIPAIKKAQAADPTWSSTYASWAYRKPIPLGGSSSSQTNYQVPVNPSIEEVFDKTGLVGDWNFDEGGGTTANDLSGSGNNGTLLNSAAWTTAGKFGQAISFDGVDDYVSVADSASLDVTTLAFRHLIMLLWRLRLGH